MISLTVLSDRSRNNFLIRSSRSALLIGKGDGGGVGGRCDFGGREEGDEGEASMVGEEDGVSGRFADIKVGTGLDMGDWKDITRDSYRRTWRRME